MRRIELPPPAEPPVRWIAWTLSILVIGAGVLVALFMMRDGGGAEEAYETASALAYGARHEAGFDVGYRWVGESDMTLEEFEATHETFESLYENSSALAYGARHEAGFDVGYRWVGESDMTLEEFEAAR